MAFIETPRFPDNMAYGSRGGPVYSTAVTVVQSGFEQRNTLWAQARHEYDASFAIKSRADIEAVRDFFNAMRGRFHGFRFKDFFDFTSAADNGTPTDTDQSIGTGDAAEVDFQLVKNYIKGTETLVRDIKKPVTGTVVVAVNGSPITEGPGAGEFQVDTTTGIITFGTAPAGAAAITAGYEFDVPVRFDSDDMPVVYDAFDVQSASIPIVELLVV